MTIRIVICMDIEAKTPAVAYAMLLQHMAATCSTDFDWESSDEWFDEDGEIPVAELESIRAAGFRAWEFEETGIDPGTPPDLPRCRQPRLQP